MCQPKKGGENGYDDYSRCGCFGGHYIDADSRHYEKANQKDRFLCIIKFINSTVKSSTIT